MPFHGVSPVPVSYQKMLPLPRELIEQLMYSSEVLVLLG